MSQGNDYTNKLLIINWFVVSGRSNERPDKARRKCKITCVLELNLYLNLLLLCCAWWLFHHRRRITQIIVSLLILSISLIELIVICLNLNDFDFHCSLSLSLFLIIIICYTEIGLLDFSRFNFYLVSLTWNMYHGKVMKRCIVNANYNEVWWGGGI